ncbi:MAG: hypothetical protein RLZZ303_3164 [Candidatus Hydrogenedentota bacterium]
MARKPEERQQYAIALFVLVTLVVTIGVAMLLGGRQKGQGLQSSQRFTAKPGTMRENAVALSSSKRQTDEQPGGASGAPSGNGGDTSGAQQQEMPAEEQKPLRVRSLSPEEAAAESPEEQSIREALNDLSPERGIEKLEALLETELNDDDRARVHAAIAKLCGQLDTPDMARQDQALQLAQAFASSPDTVLDTARTHAEILAQRGDYPGAMGRIRAARDGMGAASAERATLGVFLGGLLETQGDASAAEDAYAAAFKDAREAGSQDGEGREEVLRQAGMRLSRMYRASGRGAEADNLAGELAAALAP